MIPKTVILFGAPGSGKDTQAFAIAKAHGYFVLVTGDLFRAEVANKTEIGRKMQEIMNSGGLLPAEMVSGVVSDELSRHISVIQANGLLFDGFPRIESEIVDAESLIDQYELRPDIALYLDVKDEELRQRLQARGRTGDDPKTINARFAAFREETEPVIRYYKEKGKLVTIDGGGQKENVSKHVLQAIKEFNHDA